jgi:hypothetical protein
MAVTTSSGLTTINVLSLSSASLSVLVLLALLGTYLPTFLMHLNSIETHLDPARAAMRFVVCVRLRVECDDLAPACGCPPALPEAAHPQGAPHV